MPEYKLIALDLDGTLLNSDKQLTRTNAEALCRAAERGIEIVPTTGRFYGALPEAIRALPFLHYAITINGAQVADLRTGEVIYRAELPWRQAVELMTALDALPVIYDCYQENAAYMTAAHKERIDEMAASPHYRKMLHELREGVPELKAFLASRGRDVQKVQLFTNRPEVRTMLLRELPHRFDGLSVSSAVEDNVEINQLRANKGAALLALAAHLGLRREETMAFGDGLNDLTMLREAGLGVAMANACGEALAAADAVTASCDEDGVALGIQRYCFGEAGN